MKMSKTFKCPRCPKRFRTQEGASDHERAAHIAASAIEYDNDDSKDFGGMCCVCDASPTVAGADLCGPCCWGEAETVGGNW